MRKVNLLILITILLLLIVSCGKNKNTDKNNEHIDKFESIEVPNYTPESIDDIKNAMLTEEEINSIDVAEPMSEIDTMMEISDYNSNNITGTYERDYLQEELKEVDIDIVKELIKEIVSKENSQKCEIEIEDNEESYNDEDYKYYILNLDNSRFIIGYLDEKAYAMRDRYGEQ